MVVIEPEDRYPVVDVLPITLLLEAWGLIIEALDPVLQLLIHPLYVVLQFSAIHMMLQTSPSASVRLPRSLVRPCELPPIH